MTAAVETDKFNIVSNWSMETGERERKRPRLNWSPDNDFVTEIPETPPEAQGNHGNSSSNTTAPVTGLRLKLENIFEKELWDGKKVKKTKENDSIPTHGGKENDSRPTHEEGQNVEKCKQNADRKDKTKRKGGKSNTSDTDSNVSRNGGGGANSIGGGGKRVVVVENNRSNFGNIANAPDSN